MTKETTDQKIEKLAQMTAGAIGELQAEIADIKTNIMATKEDLKNGFALIMEQLRPMRQDYQALRQDIAPQVATHEIRLTKLEHKQAA